MYEISSDPARQLLIVRVSGFWTREIMATYRAEVGQQASVLRQAGGCKRILVDMSHYPIQSGDIADGHAAALRFARETLGARAAIVMTSALSRLQATRVATSSGHRLFNDDVAAMTWLMGNTD
ncbi:hypothetical protein [Sphingomonas sp. NFX23]|uniref:hypothetical protein n=1 Tax=Sphingomonas sp. NFX23 TaxID=2819532 RepID=UPI001202160A|nr:MAG: hypothetical protein EOP64_13530 [Sphingomonas sp.]